MRTPLIVLFFLGMVCYSPIHGQTVYPPAPEKHEQQTRFGITYTNPYVGLVDINAEETKNWLEAEKKLMTQYEKENFTRIDRFDHGLSATLWGYFGIASTPFKKRDMYMAVGYNPEGQPIVYYKKALEHEYAQLCPTNIFQKDKNDDIDVSGLALSPDKKYLSLLISHGGSDWMELKTRDIEAKKFLPDSVNWIKFNSVIWNNEGFYYVCFDEPHNKRELIEAGKGQRLMYHKLGTSMSRDRQLLTIEDEYAGEIDLRGFENEKVAILRYSRMQGERRVSIVAYFEPDSLEKGIKEFIVTPYNGFNPFEVIGMQNGDFLVKSTFKAPNGQLVVYNPNKVNDGRVLIEQFSQPLRFANNLKDKIFCIYYDMGKYVPTVFDTSGTMLRKIFVPEGFCISGFNYTINDSTTLYTLSSYEGSPRTLKFDFKNLKTVIYDESTGAIFKTEFTSKIVNYHSKDSTLIPMYVIHSKKVQPDSTSPLLLYAYGGFGVSMDPHYDPGFAMFMRSGGVVGIPLVRGGGELGGQWHKAGMRLNKQNGVDDFIAAAEYFIDNKLASPKRIAIHGGSNGGLLIGMAMVQRPELFRVAAPEVGLFDLVNFHKYTSANYVGVREYGNPKDSADFHNLYRLSPLHNLKDDIIYPATIAFTGENDDRVVPSHSYRFIAKLQKNASKLKFPPSYLLHVRKNSGHNSMGWYEMAIMYSFIYDELGMKVPW